ncbi:MAG: SDR family NAD(P)-dependent oxidoreductase, partial [Solirubrobacterales bacterium]
MKVEGSGALVAGGASGLGAATARALHEAGARVVVADLNADLGEALASELGDGASFAEADVTDPDAVKAAVDTAAGADGGLWISVCCAGVGWAGRVSGKDGPHDLEIYTKVIGVNLIGTFNVLRLACNAMNANDPDEGGERGVCVNTASIAAFDGQIGQAAYASSKAGVAGMTLPAARDMASRGVRVATIAPGTFDTPMLAA